MYTWWPLERVVESLIESGKQAFVVATMWRTVFLVDVYEDEDNYNIILTEETETLEEYKAWVRACRKKGKEVVILQTLPNKADLCCLALQTRRDHWEITTEENHPMWLTTKEAERKIGKLVGSGTVEPENILILYQTDY